jgi:hypothetical protein
VRRVLYAAWLGVSLAVIAAWAGVPLWGAIVVVAVVGGVALGSL